jgi:hypothetical protein
MSLALAALPPENPSKRLLAYKYYTIFARAG